MMWLAVALGGSLGAIARYALSLILIPAAGKFPWATFSANVIGCALMGIFYYCIVEKAIWPAPLKPLLMVGFLGALTTFSSYAMEAVVLWQSAQSLAVVYVLSSWLANLSAVGLSYWLAKSFF
ncbi:MAG TPA: fluoride efflux transporter CrcB [Marinagarivorans sp.]|jgi:CrcB protein|nr:fluoride efflux transporter CrcB [Cellvibrionaceae bacterium]HMY41115.1 fluoride efflux transporter CrcB [Marinagarivorans sp.]